MSARFIASTLLVIFFSTTAAAQQYDLVIRRGRVVDGTGRAASLADVAVANGRIAAVGRNLGAGRAEINARGLVVAPGFIDVHGHVENILERPRAENFLRMGVTTVITGNCGFSDTDIGRTLRAWEQREVGVNLATLIGHNAIRESAMGGIFKRPPTAGELEKMRTLVDRAMRDGALGLSTGLIYLPGTYAQTEEIIALAKVAGARGGLYASHMRDEGDRIDAALEELFRIAREAKARAQISHIKLNDKAVWGQAARILKRIEKARAEGLDIAQDQYIYTASSASLHTLLPSESLEGGREKFLERLNDPAQKSAIVAKMRRNGPFDFAVLGIYPKDPALQGKSVAEAAQLRRGSASLDDQIEMVFEIARNGGAGAVFHRMQEADVETFLRHPKTMLGADSGILPPDVGVPHPRGYGNAARVLSRYARERKLLTLEEAVRRMTALPAATFRLKDRGQVRAGFHADLVIFNPQTIRDTATFSDPHRYPEGILHVYVNGVPAVQNAAATTERAGKVLRFDGQFAQ